MLVKVSIDVGGYHKRKGRGKPQAASDASLNANTRACMKNASVPSHVRPICGAGVSMPSGPKLKLGGNKGKKGKKKTNALQNACVPSQRFLQSRAISASSLWQICSLRCGNMPDPPLMGIVEAGICNAYFNKPRSCVIYAQSTSSAITTLAARLPRGPHT